ncbi:MAG: hypothetical protein JWO67_2999 [Streptosporangiaceae bacterium]|nr:hypothetical protein [Streptosporangiaceae bacterium]
MTTLAFVDTETTHLSPELGDAWEIAVIRRDHDGVETEGLWQVRVPLEHAEEEALRISRYHERFGVPDGCDAISITSYGRPARTARMRLSLPEMLFDFQEMVQDAVLVGSNPGFDDRFLRKLLHAHGRKVGWHYRPTCIANLAEGYLWRDRPEVMAQQKGPLSSRWLSQQMGVELPTADVAHTALGDARWAKAVFDAVTDFPQERTA